MDKNENISMDLKEKAERLKYMFDALNRQKKKYDRLKNTRGLSKSEYEQYTEVTLKLSNFNEKCKNFIRPRKNGVGKFSTEDYISWCHEQEGMAGRPGERAGPYKGPVPGQHGDGKQMYYDVYKGEGGKPYGEMQPYRQDEKYVPEREKSAATRESETSKNKESVSAEKEMGGAGEVKGGPFQTGSRGMPYAEGPYPMAPGQGRADGKFYSQVPEGKNSPVMCSRPVPEHNPGFYPSARSDQGFYSFPPQVGAYNPGYFNFPNGFMSPNGAMRSGHASKTEDIPGMSPFRGNEFYYNRNDAPNQQRYYPQYMGGDGPQMGNEFYYGKQGSGRVQKPKSGYEQMYMSPGGGGMVPPGHGRMSNEMMSPSPQDRNGRFGQGLMSPRLQSRGGAGFGGRMGMGVMSPGSAENSVCQRPGLNMMSPQIREQGGFSENRLGPGMMSPKMQDLNNFSRFGHGMMSPKMQDPAGAFLRTGPGMMSPKLHDVNSMRPGIPDNYSGMLFKSPQNDIANHLSGALGSNSDFQMNGYQFDPKMFPTKDQRERMYMHRGAQRGQFSPGMKNGLYPVPGPYFNGHKTPHSYEFSSNMPADSKMTDGFKESDMNQFFQDTLRSKQGEMADDGSMGRALLQGKMEADLESDPTGKKRHKRSPKDALRQGARRNQFADGRSSSSAGNLTLRNFEHGCHMDSSVSINNVSTNNDDPYTKNRGSVHASREALFERGLESQNANLDGKGAAPKKYYDFGDRSRDNGPSAGDPAKAPRIYKFSTKNQININRAELENLIISNRVCLPQDVKDHLLIHLDAFLHEAVTVACAVAVLKSKRRLTLNDIKVVMANKCKGGFEGLTGASPGRSERPARDFAEHSKILEMLESDKNK